MLEMQMNEDIKNSFAGLAQWTYYSAIVGFISAGVSIVNAVSVVSKPVSMVTHLQDLH